MKRCKLEEKEEEIINGKNVLSQRTTALKKIKHLNQIIKNHIIRTSNDKIKRMNSRIRHSTWKQGGANTISNQEN